MTTEEIFETLASRLRMSAPDERAAMACDLYRMDIVDRQEARKLLGIDRTYDEQVLEEVYFKDLEERFANLPIEFLARKEHELQKELEG